MYPQQGARDLRSVLLRHAADEIARNGTSNLSMRALARTAGVSHAAHRHHFSDRIGLLTALAAEGFKELAERLSAAARSGSFVEVGVAYVLFAQDCPAHFTVMFETDLLDTEHPNLMSAKSDAFAVLRQGVETKTFDGAVEDAAAAIVAGWSLAHGLAVLAASGALQTAGLAGMFPDQELESLTRRAVGMLYGSPTGPS